MVGVDPHASSNIERGERIPTVGTVARLASALGVCAGWLAYGLGEQHTEGLHPTTDGMGTRIAEVRIERGLTKADVARMAHLSASSFAKIENGGQSGVDTIELLAVALAVSPAWLAFGEGPRALPPRRRTTRAAASSSP